MRLLPGWHLCGQGRLKMHLKSVTMSYSSKCTPLFMQHIVLKALSVTVHCYKGIYHYMRYLPTDTYMVKDAV